MAFVVPQHVRMKNLSGVNAAGSPPRGLAADTLALLMSAGRALVTLPSPQERRRGAAGLLGESPTA